MTFTLTHRKFVVSISIPSFFMANFSASKYSFGNFLISKRLNIGKEIKTSLFPSNKKKYIKSADGEIRDLKFFYKSVVQIKPDVTNFCIFQNQIKTTQLQIGLKAIITIYYNFALLFYNLCSNNIIVKPLKLKFLDSVFVKCGFLTSWIESLRTLVAECE